MDSLHLRLLAAAALVCFQLPFTSATSADETPDESQLTSPTSYTPTSTDETPQPTLPTSHTPTSTDETPQPTLPTSHTPTSTDETPQPTLPTSHTPTNTDEMPQPTLPTSHTPTSTDETPQPTSPTSHTPTSTDETPQPTLPTSHTPTSTDETPDGSQPTPPSHNPTSTDETPDGSQPTPPSSYTPTSTDETPDESQPTSPTSHNPTSTDETPDESQPTSLSSYTLTSTSPASSLPSPEGGTTNHTQPSDSDVVGGKGSTTVAGAAVGGILGVLFLIVVAVSVVLIALRFRHHGYKQETSVVHYDVSAKQMTTGTLDSEFEDILNATYERVDMGEDGTKTTSFAGPEQMDLRPIPVKEFGDYVERNHANNNQGFKDQFQLLNTGSQHPTTIAVSPENKLKNRFPNVIVYDDNRVVLKPIGDQEHDYINASTVDGYFLPNEFIATQGPLPTTTIDFWRLVWQEKVPSIVMLTSVEEGGQTKCEQYWPDSGSQNFGPFQVTITSQQVSGNFAVRTFTVQLLSSSDPPLKVTQFHFMDWTYSGIPIYTASLVEFHHLVSSCHDPGKGPLLVHCSGGSDRTGTFIAIDHVLEQVEEGVVDIAGTINKLHQQRMKLIKSPEQYIFIHDAILEAIKCGNTQIRTNEFNTTLKELKKLSESGKTGFDIQFHVLGQITLKPDQVTREEALKHPCKNRSTAYVPSDFWRVPLKEEYPDYIHATYVNGYQQRKAFIIAQGPMESTCRDFWKMVYDQKCGAIVMLSDLTEGGEDICCQYWPTDDNWEVGDMIVEARDEEEREGYTVANFSIMHQTKEAHSVSQFRILDWDVDGRCSNTKTIINVIEEAVRVQRRTEGSPIVVHCSDTVSRSGMFCAIATAIERCKVEGVVDVFQVVKALRTSKPGAVPTVEQYQFIFDVVLLYLDSFGTYANFKFRHHGYKQETSVVHYDVSAKQITTGTLDSEFADILNATYERVDVREDGTKTTSFAGPEQMDLRPIPVKEFGDYVERNHANNNQGFKDQFQLLNTGSQHPTTIAVSPENKLKNRFPNVIVYDDNRVVLKPIGDQEHDYINASTVDGYFLPNEFIATQGPLPTTTIDFWRLVWQEKVPSIVMLTSVKEGGQTKCEQYWPDSGSQGFGPFQVTITSQQVSGNFAVRTFTVQLLSSSDPPLKVTQFHFMDWTYSGIPIYTASLVEFHHLVSSCHDPGKGPLLVHCSGGSDRTGTFIAIDHVLEQVEEGVVDIAGTINKLHQQRMKLIKSPEQYIFIHDAILEAIKCGNTQIRTNEFNTTLKELKKLSESGKTGFDIQFHVLGQITLKPDQVTREEALKHPCKNRSTAYVPSDFWRVPLKEEYPDYIHATYVNGYQQRKAFIIAQGPMESTCRDFWKMVYDQKCGAIVMLSDLTEGGEDICCQYWPTDDNWEVGDMIVEARDEEEWEGYTVANFSIMHQTKEAHSVSQFRILDWDVDGRCSNTKTIINIIEEAVRVQRRTEGSPIVVHCSDTVSRSGMFCAIATAIERCMVEGVVDVFQAVKALRTSKPGAVLTVEQYQFIFDVVLLYLDSFGTYANFKFRHHGYKQETSVVHYDVSAKQMTTGTLDSEFEDILNATYERVDVREDGTKTTSFAGPEQMDLCPIPVKEFGDYVERNHANNNQGFKDQFQLLNTGSQHPTTIAVSPENKLKNRFANAIVYDDNRVVLKPIGDQEHDYINASAVDGYFLPNEFIATQGPLPTTTIDFWRLVWQEKVPSIVMLTSVEEGGQTKCEQYWPDSGSQNFGPFQVTITSQQVSGNFAVRTFTVQLPSSSDPPLKVTQFHFMDWIYSGIPIYTASLVEFHHLVCSCHDPGKGPLLVHCSGGSDRTGTFIAIDHVLEQVEEGVVDIAGTINKLHQQRMKLIKSPEQYIFIHDAILEAIKCGNTQIRTNEFNTTLKELKKLSESGKTGFDIQFHVLGQITLKPDQVTREEALKHPCKNRSTAYVPSDFWRVPLKEEYPDYIHATYVNGYQQRKAFIIAEGPMESTCRDFWKMVYDQKCGAIVMLSDLTEGGEEVCCQYWPTDDNWEVGDMIVEARDEEEWEGYTVANFSIMHQTKEAHSVSQFRILDWDVDGRCSNTKTIISVIEEAVRVQRRTEGSPIVVHCSDTVSRSGMFCAIATAIERCKVEGVVDVFQAVKALRTSKPGAVLTVEQYQFIFDVVLLYLDSFGTYANFK